MPTPRCIHCTNSDPTLLEPLDDAGVVWFCHVCAKTFVNPSLSAAASVNAVAIPPPSSGILTRRCGVLAVVDPQRPAAVMNPRTPRRPHDEPGTPRPDHRQRPTAP